MNTPYEEKCRMCNLHHSLLRPCPKLSAILQGPGEKLPHVGGDEPGSVQ